jgi:hypothetical protein
MVHLPMEELVGAIRNTDIVWGFLWHDRAPEQVRGATVLVARHCDLSAVPALVAALDDPERFVAAHFLLGTILHLSVPVSVSEYDGLSIDDKSMPIDAPGVRAKLKTLWRRRLAALSFVTPLPSR